MSWLWNSRGKTETTANNFPKINTNHTFGVASETISLGAAKANRYTSVIDFIPTDGNGRQLPFTVISNTGTTNLSGSASDQLYACLTRTGTFFQIAATLRDCNYLHDTTQGTSFRSIDNAIRVRYVDPAYVGQYPYYKIRVLQAAVESSGKTVGFAITIGMPQSAKKDWDVHPNA